MKNLSETSSNFILLGVVEMENFRFLYSALGLVIYATSIFLCSLILYVIWTEESLHEPMYLLIGNLVFNGIFGSSAFLPKLITDLFFGSRTISIGGCLLQSFCIHCFAAVELFTFTLMAHDRYLAIGQPLRYSTIMTNRKAWKFIIANWTTSIISVLVPIIMTACLPLCGVDINNVFCDNMSLMKLACGDTSVNNIFGAVESFLINIVCILIIVYYYIRTFLVCMKISKEVFQKAVRTLVTHLAAFSTFMASSLFVLLRDE
ncbi:olfactory receptor 4D5-like [Dendropsophus ebraccatus]|uniref:olfactory receptor 4D5-like n=1 Tax=Dendropsophus ebraccatus TaxID=150705 RepID=UPI003831C39A